MASWRFVEVVAFQARIVLAVGRTSVVLARFERSLILLAFNVVELSLVTGVCLRAAGFGTATRSWFAGFTLTTLTGLPSGPAAIASRGRTEIDIVSVAGTTGALILFGGGVALLIGLISQKFREYQ